MGLSFPRTGRQPDRESPLTTAGTASALPGLPLGYRPALDGLRGVSILLVMAVHSVPRLVPGGSLGVDVFFVLSGFLITMLLVQERERTGSISLKAFYLRRALRLLPALMVFLAAWMLYSTCFLDWDRALLTRKGAAGALLYYGNWRISHSRNRPADLFTHTWSLSVEEQFYLVWPMLLAGLLWWRAPRRVILTLVGLGVAASALTRAGLLAERGGPAVRFYMHTHLRADALLIGCLAGLLAGWGLLPQSRRGLVVLRAAAWAAALCLLWHFVKIDNGSTYLYYGGFTLVALAVAVVLCAVLHAPPLWVWVLEASPVVWLGRLSYGIYLWHFPLFMTLHLSKFPVGARILTVWGPRTYLMLHLLLAYGASLSAASLSYYGIERPLLRLKSRLHPARATAGQGLSSPPVALRRAG